MKQNFGLVVAGVLILLALFFLKGFKDQNQNLSENLHQEVENIEVIDSEEGERIETGLKADVEKEVSYFDIKRHPRIMFVDRKKSDALLKEFSRQAYVSLPKVPDYIFEDYSEDDLGILVGKNQFGDTITLLASREIPKAESAEDVKQFVIKNKDIFPELEIPHYNFDVKKFKTYKDVNGFSEVNIWYTLNEGELHVLTQGIRADEKGSYGVLVSGDKDRLFANEENYIDYFEQIKALPAP